MDSALSGDSNIVVIVKTTRARSFIANMAQARPSPCLEGHTMKKKHKSARKTKPSFSIYEDLYQEMVQYAKTNGMAVDEALNRAPDFFLDIHS